MCILVQYCFCGEQVWVGLTSWILGLVQNCQVNMLTFPGLGLALLHAFFLQSGEEDTLFFFF